MADLSLADCKHVKKYLKINNIRKCKAGIVRSMIINIKFDKTVGWKPFFVYLFFKHVGVCKPSLNDFCYNSRTT